MLIKSYPKVNLCLLIGKKKKDKHKIKSIFYKVNSVYDELNIKISGSEDKITYFQNDKNIVIENCILKKTLKILREHKILKDDYYFNIEVNKKIPMKAGLGGGSSNAGTFIKYLIDNNLLNRQIPKKLINTIGSDVMFFVYDFQIAKVMGYGEKIKKINIPNNLEINLIETNVDCSTKEIFKIYDSFKNRPKNSFRKQLKYFKNKKYNLLVNELELSVFKYSPELEKIVKSLRNNKEIVHISGSGGTCFKMRG